MTTSTLTLADFLLARIAEDEAIARDATHSRWDEGIIRSGSPGRWRGIEAYAVLEHVSGGLDGRMAGDEVSRADSASDVAHIARHDPARVLAECEAKRRIVDIHQMVTQDLGATGCYNCIDIDCGSEVILPGPCPTLRALATPYSDHPDYRQEWKP